MTVRYHQYRNKIIPDYMCQREGIQQGKQICQCVQGKYIDQAISNIIIELMSPVTLELSIAVQKELEQRWEESDILWQQRLEQARFQVNIAKRRFLQVDPDNRLVASTLEADWNKELTELEQIQTEYEQYQQRKASCISQEQEKKIRSLSQDFPTLWNAPNTAVQERKRMIRLLIEDVTLKKMTDNIEMHIRFRGGQTRSIELERPRNTIEIRHTDQVVIMRITELSKTHPDSIIARLLNEEGLKPYQKSHFTAASIYQLRHNRNIFSYRQHLLNQGWLTAKMLAKRINVATKTIHDWREAGLIQGILCSDKKEYLFKVTPNAQWPQKKQGSPLSKRGK